MQAHTHLHTLTYLHTHTPHCYTHTIIHTHSHIHTCSHSFKHAYIHTHAIDNAQKKKKYFFLFFFKTLLTILSIAPKHVAPWVRKLNWTDLPWRGQAALGSWKCCMPGKSCTEGAKMARLVVDMVSRRKPPFLTCQWEDRSSSQECTNLGGEA